jgi:hypothetical protein
LQDLFARQRQLYRPAALLRQTQRDRFAMDDDLAAEGAAHL